MLKTYRGFYFPEGYFDFIQYVQTYCERHNKTIEIRKSYSVRNQGGCMGYCDGDSVVLAGKHPLALQTLVHEFAHLTQEVDKHPLWSVAWEHDFFDTKPRRPAYDFKRLLEVIYLERDCEARSLKLIKKFNLPIDPTDYTIKANAYLFFYHYCYLRRSWVPSNSIYKEKILAEMPEKLVLPRALQSIDMNLMQIYERELS